ncbi:MAG: hypothetical protein FWD25_12150, partial [Clostridia bacterium]|nr:hypothetical protein [Clostridia bacterium]
MSPLFFWLLLLLAGALAVRVILKRRGPTARPEEPDFAQSEAEPEEPETPEDPLDATDWDAERDSRAWQELAEEFEANRRPEEAARALQAAVDVLEEDQADRACELHRELAALYIRRQSPHEAYKHLAA